MTRLLIVLAVCAAFAWCGRASCDTCGNACSLTLPALISGNTVAQGISNVSCIYNMGNAGSWYKIVGTGKVVTVDTCDDRNNFDTILFVMGGCSMTGGVYTQCITMDDDSCGNRHSKVSFQTALGGYYFIFVTGYRSETGVYYLAAAEQTPPTAYQCHNAVNVTRFPYVSESDTSTTISVPDTCLSTTSAGLWYHLRGNGEPFLAHTCNLATTFDTIIEVYLECNSTLASQCVTYNDDSCYKQSMVWWRSVMNQDYWVFVTGHNNERGAFTLEIEKTELNPHSRCDDPLEITTFPYVYTGTTEKMQESWSECGQRNRNGMWFRMHGQNRKVIISTCAENNYDGDSVIDVYSACSATTHKASQCVATNDDYCGMNAAVVIDAYSPLYYIFVSGYASNLKGINFTLAVLPYENANNSQCWYAKEIDTLPFDVSGNTRTQEHCHASCDGTSPERKGAWYRYTHMGTSTVVTATTCNKWNIMPSKLEVYNDCHLMSCAAQASVDVKKNCTSLTFPVIDGQTYNLFLTAQDMTNPGSYYHVDVFEAVPNNHSLCVNAEVVPTGQMAWRTEQYTGMSKPSWSSCEGRMKQGYWMRVVGDGTKYLATTCDTQTDFDTVLELYDRCVAENVHEGCLEYNDDYSPCGRASQLEWDTEKGAVYWLFVTGSGTETGVFAVQIYSLDSPSNAHCLTSKGIPTLPFYDYGLTTYAKVSNASCETGTRKGLWYSFVGDNRWVSVETCGIETNFETDVEVYMDCNKEGGKVCLTHNHDSKCAPQTVITFPAIKYVIYWIYVTGVSAGVMAEGFFKLSILPGKEILPPSESSNIEPTGLTTGQVIGIIFAAFWGVGLIAGAIAGAFGIYKKRHIDYVHIGGSDSAPVSDAPASSSSSSAPTAQ